MSRAFEGLGCVAALVFVLIVIAGAINGGAKGVAHFIENHYIIIGIVLLIIIAGICYLVSGSLRDLSLGLVITNCIACALALAQNAGFLVYGLYRSLTVYTNDAFLTVLAVGGYILVYIIDVVITACGISMTADKPWGSLVLILIAIAGLFLSLEW